MQNIYAQFYSEEELKPQSKEFWANFDYKNDVERIKQTKIRFQNTDVNTAFSEYFNTPLINPSSTIVIYEVGELYNGVIENINSRYCEIVIPNSKQSVYSYESRIIQNLRVGELVTFKIIGFDHETPLISIAKGEKDLFLNLIMNSDNFNDTIIKIKNLELVKGGYIGDTDINNKEYIGTIPVFIPGSQIVLNIERNFDRWIGTTVYGVVENIILKNNIEFIGSYCTATLYCNSKKL